MRVVFSVIYLEMYVFVHIENFDILFVN
jgi:hypothetical protein